MSTSLKTLLVLNFAVELSSGLALMLMPLQAAELLYPSLEANRLALKFARTAGIALFVLGLLSILPLVPRFRSSLWLVLGLFSVYHLLAAGHNLYLVLTGAGSVLATAVHGVLLAGFVVYAVARKRC